jgi:hypothetical protein
VQGVEPVGEEHRAGGEARIDESTRNGGRGPGLVASVYLTRGSVRPTQVSCSGPKGDEEENHVALLEKTRVFVHAILIRWSKFG